MTADELAAAVGTAAAHELASALERIKHCLGQLNDEQVWWRSQPSLNSIGNLILHLCGNLRQWIVAGLGGAADVRNRPAEFAERGPIPKDELLRRLEAVVEEAKAILADCRRPPTSGSPAHPGLRRDRSWRRSSTAFRTSGATRRRSST